MPIATGAIIGGALIGGAARLGSTLFGNRARRKEQRRVEQREDTAIQRRVADLQAAGLSPTLAAGSAATTAAPPQIENPDLEGFNPEQMIALKQGMAEVGLTEAQERLTDVMTREHGFAADLKSQEWLHNIVANPIAIEQMRADLVGTNITNSLHNEELKIKREFGRNMALAEAEIARNRAILSNYDLTESEQRLLAMRLTLMEEERNRGIYRDLGLPSDANLGDRTQLGVMIGTEANRRSSTRSNTGGRARPPTGFSGRPR